MPNSSLGKRSPGRPSDRRDVIVQYLRDQIVDGNWGPGSQLPTRTEIEERFSAGPVTVQRALDRLTEEGFVHARGSRGTFVAEHPPHLNRIGIVFATRPDNWNRYWLALQNEARKLEPSLVDKSLAFYYGVDGHSDSEEFQQLLRDLENRRLAGLLFTSCPYDLRGSRVLSSPHVARVAWSGSAELGFPGVNTDGEMFRERALQYFKEKGRRKVAVISAPLDNREKVWIDPIRSAGLETRPYWVHSVFLRDKINAFYLTQLLMRCEDKPDALIITDDNLVERVTAGLVASGVRIPEDLEVLAHCNYPWLPESHVPVQFLGYDVRTLLKSCLDIIDLQRRDESVPLLTRIPAQFSHEVAE